MVLVNIDSDGLASHPQDFVQALVNSLLQSSQQRRHLWWDDLQQQMPLEVLQTHLTLRACIRLFTIVTCELQQPALSL